jgi:hypothetical protein
MVSPRFWLSVDDKRDRLTSRASVDTMAGTAELMVELRAGLDAAAAQIGAERLLLSVCPHFPSVANLSIWLDLNRSNWEEPNS